MVHGDLLHNILRPQQRVWLTDFPINDEVFPVYGGILAVDTEAGERPDLKLVDYIRVEAVMTFLACGVDNNLRGFS